MQIARFSSISDAAPASTCSYLKRHDVGWCSCIMALCFMERRLWDNTATTSGVVAGPSCHGHWVSHSPKRPVSHIRSSAAFAALAFRTNSELLVFIFLPGVLRHQRSEEARVLIVWTCGEEQDVSGPCRPAVAEAETP